MGEEAWCCASDMLTEWNILPPSCLMAGTSMSFHFSTISSSGLDSPARTTVTENTRCVDGCKTDNAGRERRMAIRHRERTKGKEQKKRGTNKGEGESNKRSSQGTNQKKRPTVTLRVSTNSRGGDGRSSPAEFGGRLCFHNDRAEVMASQAWR